MRGSPPPPASARAEAAAPLSTWRATVDLRLDALTEEVKLLRDRAHAQGTALGVLQGTVEQFDERLIDVNKTMRQGFEAVRGDVAGLAGQLPPLQLAAGAGANERETARHISTARRSWIMWVIGLVTTGSLVQVWTDWFGRLAAWFGRH